MASPEESKWSDYLDLTTDTNWNYMYPCTEDKYSKLNKDQQTYYMTMAQLFNFTHRVTDLIEQYLQAVESLPASVPRTSFDDIQFPLTEGFENLLGALQEITGFNMDAASNHDMDCHASMQWTDKALRKACQDHVNLFITNMRLDMHDLQAMPAQNCFPQFSSSHEFVRTSALPTLIEKVVDVFEESARKICETALPPSL